MLIPSNPRTRLRWKIISGWAVLVISVVFGWLRLVSPIVLILIIFLAGVYINWSLCWKCRAPYTLRLRGMWRNLGTCVVCGARIEDKPARKVR
jgi:hypothetical protein